MIRITIEVNDKEVSSTTVQSTSTLGIPSPELLTRAAALGALDAGNAPSDMGALAPIESNAGVSREHGSPTEYSEDPKGRKEQ